MAKITRLPFVVFQVKNCVYAVPSAYVQEILILPEVVSIPNAPPEVRGVINLRGKLGAAFGSYGWSGEAVRMIEDRMRGLKMRVPVPGLRLKLIPTEDELNDCRDFGRKLAAALVGGEQGRVIDFSELG